MYVKKSEKNKDRVFFLYYIENSLNFNRFAVSVNRKIGNAVKRNYIKRVMRELFIHNNERLKGRYDIWVSIKNRFEKNDFKVVEKIFRDMIDNIDKNGKKRNFTSDQGI